MNNPIHNKSFRLRPCVATILLAILAPQAYAAVEPTFPSIPVYLTGGQSSVRPNMLLFMDNSGSMTEVMTDGQRRDVVAKKAAKNVITEYREQYRWGLASFNSNKVQGAFAGATIIKILKMLAVVIILNLTVLLQRLMLLVLIQVHLLHRPIMI